MKSGDQPRGPAKILEALPPCTTPSLRRKAICANLPRFTNGDALITAAVANCCGTTAGGQFFQHAETSEERDRACSKQHLNDKMSHGVDTDCRLHRRKRQVWHDCVLHRDPK